MHKKVIGRFIKTRGSYDENVTYYIDNLVYYNGSQYRCLEDNIMGILPTDANYWEIFVSKGDSGSAENAYTRTEADTIFATKEELTDTIQLLVNSGGTSGGTSGVNIWVGEQAEFDALSNKDDNTLYFITG